MKYIDADKLIEKFEKMIDNIPASVDSGAGYVIDEVYNIIESFQQEQPEVNLEKEIDKEWEKCNPIDEGMGVEMAYIHIEAFDIIARHFYELGLNARK